MIRHHDYPLFFSGVAKLFVDDPDFFRLFRKQGYSVSDWPECDAKSLAMSFEAIAAEKSIESAKVLLRSKMEKLAGYTLPHEIGELWAVYGEMRAFGVWSQVGQKILSDPMRGPEFLSLVRQPRNLQAIRLQEALGPHLEKRLSAVARDEKQKVIIHDWVRLSEGIGGFNPGRVFLFVAGTGVGKTTLTLNLVSSAVKDPEFPILFVNMEMTPEDIIDRVVSITAVVPLYWAERINPEFSERVAAIVPDLYERAAFFVTDGRAMTIEEISSQIIHYQESEGIRLVVVDYDQKIRTGFRGEEWQAIQKAIEQLEEIAKSTQTAIIVLAQGDENGDPKASKRSTQPCSAVISLYQEGSKYFLETKKNRYGKKFKLSLNADFEKYQIKEGDYVFEDQNQPANLSQKLYPKKGFP